MTQAQIDELMRGLPGQPSWHRSTRQLGSRIEIATFSIAKYPVTHAEFATFIEATRRPPFRHWNDGSQGGVDHPVVWISFALAQAYVRWRSATDDLSYRLPTAAEWEAAARGPDRRLFPWGDDLDADRCHVKARRTASVFAHAPAGDSPFGVSDMVGNAREWTAPLDDDGLSRVRGGGFLATAPAQLWCTHEDRITTGAKASIGFRLALPGT